MISLSHDPGVFSFSILLVSLFLEHVFMFFGLCPHFDGASFGSLLRKDTCEVVFWRTYISANVFILTSHVIDGLVRYRILRWKSFSSRRMKILFHHLIVSIVAILKL